MFEITKYMAALLREILFKYIANFSKIFSKTQETSKKAED